MRPLVRLGDAEPAGVTPGLSAGRAHGAGHGIPGRGVTPCSQRVVPASAHHRRARSGRPGQRNSPDGFTQAIIVTPLAPVMRASSQTGVGHAGRAVELHPEPDPPWRRRDVALDRRGRARRRSSPCRRRPASTSRSDPASTAAGGDGAPALHVPASWQVLGATQVNVVGPAQLPAVQTSPCVQALPSLQALPSGIGVEEHVPVSGSRTAAWHESWPHKR